MTNDPPPGWATATLGEVFEIVGGSTPRTSSPDYWDGDIPWITPDDLSGHDGVLVSRGRRSITEAGFASTSTHMLPSGSILFTSRAPIGYTAITANPLCTNQGFKSLVPPAGVESRYVYWYLQHATPQIRELGSGTTFKEMSKKRMATVPIVLPSTAEQKRIVAAIEEHLSRLDAANDAITAAQAKIEASRRSVLAEAFAGRLVPQDANDEPASTLLERIAADRHPARRPPQPNRPAPPDQRPPPGWTWSTLGQVCSRPQYGWTTKSDRNAGLPYLRTTDISRGDVNWNEVPSCVNEPSRLEDFLLRDGDIVVCRAGTVGASLLLKNPPRSVFASYLIRLRVCRQLLPGYVAYFLQSPRFWAAIANTTIGIAIPNVNAKKLTAIRIPLAPFAEQERIVDAIEEHFSRLDAASETISAVKAKIEASRRSVLAEAFSGRLVPHDPNDEPATVLLERIGETRTV